MWENGEIFRKPCGFLNAFYFDEEFGHNWKGAVLRPSFKKKLQFHCLYPYVSAAVKEDRRQRPCPSIGSFNDISEEGGKQITI